MFTRVADKVGLAFIIAAVLIGDPESRPLTKADLLEIQRMVWNTISQAGVGVAFSLSMKGCSHRLHPFPMAAHKCRYR